MSTYYSICLESNDLGQVLDGLRARADAWSKTGEYLETGHLSDESFVCEECSDPHEAKAIAMHYQEIIRRIEQQMQR